MNEENSILVIGSVAFDDVETPFGKRENSLGGAAIYFSIAASKFAPVKIVGVAGKDYPSEVIKVLQRHNIDTTGLEIRDGETFRWGGKYHNDINIRDTLYTHLNTFSDFKPKISETHRNTPYIFLGNIQPELQLEVLNNVENPKFVALDTMDLWINSAKGTLTEVISRVNLLLINDSEFVQLSNELNLRKGLGKIHRLGPKYIVVKKGEHGALISNNNVLFYAPAFPVLQPTDPTGAGDSFAGGLMGYLASRNSVNFRELKKALIYGSVLGSYCVEDFSIDGLLNLDKNMIENRYKQIRKLVSL
jgi:sugar/nucleoside kinase (ribokinase family)